jgi:tetratricopeptide (TPR) repeat protein
MMTLFLRAKALSGKEADARAVLEPLIARTSDDGRVWRAIWMQLAGSDLKNAAASADWLRFLAPKIPANHPDERIELARAWYTLAMRNRAAATDEGALDEAIKLLDPLINAPNPPVAAILLRGALADRGQDFRTAEDCYRRGLVLSPDQPDALNNLAYLILLRGGDLNEADKLISRAIELAPGTAGFYDTQARIQARMGRRDNALAAFDKALKLEPNNLEALIGLASTLCDAGRRDSAAGLMAQIDTVMKNKPPITPQLRKELEALRTTIKASL